MAYCQQCGEVVAPGEGKLSLSRGEHARAQEAREAFERERRERIAAAEPNDFRARLISPSDVPPRAQWVVFHYRCRPAEHWDGYGFEVDRMRTCRDLMGVIIHLADKDYFEHTDLPTVLREMHYRTHGGQTSRGVAYGRSVPQSSNGAAPPAAPPTDLDKLVQGSTVVGQS